MTDLRVLLVADAVGGVWTYSLELARALRPLGVEAILAVAGPPPRPQQLEAAAGIRLIESSLPLEWLDDDPERIAAAGEELGRLAASEGVDIVQTNSASLIAAGTFGCPCVAVQHSCVATWWEAVKGAPLAGDFEWRRALVRKGLERAAAVIAPTEAFADMTRRMYELSRPVLAVRNGRTPSNIRALPQGNFVFTAARLWDEGKNVRTLDRAAARIDAPFQAAGPARGPNGASIELANIAMLGQLGETRIAGLLGARPIFTSAAIYEPFGLSVLEAAQAGCALVLSNIPSHRELWKDAALFVEAFDSDGFAEAVSNLLDNAEKRLALGRSARARAIEYSPQRMAREMVDVYASITQSEPRLIAGAA